MYKRQTPNPEVVANSVETQLDGVTVYVWKDISAVPVPEGFAATTAPFGDATIGVFKNEAGIMLAYVTDATGDHGDTMLFDGTTFMPYVTLTLGGAYTLTPLGDLALPEGYLETQVALGLSLIHI